MVIMFFGCVLLMYDLPVLLLIDFRSSVWRLLVHLFLSGGLTAVLSVSLLASKRLQPCKTDL